MGNNVDFFRVFALGANGGHISLLLSLLGKKSCNLLCVPRLLQQFPELPRNSSAECVLTSSRAFVILFSNRSPLLPPFAARRSVGQNLCPPPSQKNPASVGVQYWREREGKNKGFVRSLASSENAHFRGNLMPYSSPMAAVAVAPTTTIERREEYSEYSKTSPLLLFSSSSALSDGARFAIFWDEFFDGQCWQKMYSLSWSVYEIEGIPRTFFESQDQVASHSPPPFTPPHPLAGKRRKPTHTNSFSPRGGWSLPV